MNRASIVLLIPILLLAAGCGRQHIRLEENPVGLADFIYLTESTSRLYESPAEDTRWESETQFAPFSLVYTGPWDCTVGIRAELNRYRSGTLAKSDAVTGFSFELAEQEAKDYTQQAYAPSSVAEVSFSGPDERRARHFKIYAPRSELRNGHWYQLILRLERVACEEKATEFDPKSTQGATVMYEFYIAESNTLIATIVGMSVIVGFSMLGF